MQISFNVLYKRPVGITIIALFVIGGAHFGSQAFYGDSPKIEVEDEGENQFQISLSSSPLTTLKFSPMREAANSYSQAASRASFTRMWHRSMLAKNRVEMANDSGDDSDDEGKCPPCPPLPPEKQGSFERIDTNHGHGECKGAHKHTWVYEINQEPYPSCVCHERPRYGKVECLE